MNLLLWIIFGGLVGWIASLLMKTDSSQGIFLNIIVGIVGALLGGWMMNYFGKIGVTGFNIYSFVVALLGSIIFIAIIKFLQRLAH